MRIEYYLVLQQNFGKMFSSYITDLIDSDIKCDETLNENKCENLGFKSECYVYFKK